MHTLMQSIGGATCTRAQLRIARARCCCCCRCCCRRHCSACPPPGGPPPPGLHQSSRGLEPLPALVPSRASRHGWAAHTCTQLRTARMRQCLLGGCRAASLRAQLALRLRMAPAAVANEQTVRARVRLRGSSSARAVGAGACRATAQSAATRGWCAGSGGLERCGSSRSLRQMSGSRHLRRQTGKWFERAVGCEAAAARRSAPGGRARARASGSGARVTRGQARAQTLRFERVSAAKEQGAGWAGRAGRGFEGKRGPEGGSPPPSPSGTQRGGERGKRARKGVRGRGRALSRCRWFEGLVEGWLGSNAHGRRAMRAHLYPAKQAPGVNDGVGKGRGGVAG